MTKEEKEQKRWEEYEEAMENKKILLVAWKHRIKWSKIYLIYFPIFLVLFVVCLTLIFVLGKQGLLFIPIASLLFMSWGILYLYFVISCNYTSAATPLGFVLTVLIPIGGFIVGVAMAIEILITYKTWIIRNSDENIKKVIFWQKNT